MLETRRMRRGDDFRQVEAIQRSAWGIDDITIVPAHLLEAVANYNAGCVTAALADGRAVGFMLALATNEPAVQHLHMIGVDKEWQVGHRGIHVGEALFRHYAAEVAPQLGVSELEWTYDPLLGQNASLYFNKLGARAMRYESDAYSTSGEEGIYRGLPADRLLVRWNPRRRWERPEANLPAWEAHQSDEVRSERFALRIPYDLHDLKAKDMAGACRERLRTRAIFQTALAQGYEVVNFVSLPPPKGINYYVFLRRVA